MAFDIPREQMVMVDSVEVRLDPSPHPFELQHEEAIASNWTTEIAAQPALFNGRMAMLSGLSYRDGALKGRCHEVNYATFLYLEAQPRQRGRTPPSRILRWSAATMH